MLPVSPSTPIVTLGEGSTPLLRAERLSAALGLEIWLKCEGANPTGSFKDRGMAVAVARAVEGGARAIVCASHEPELLAVADRIHSLVDGPYAERSLR